MKKIFTLVFIICLSAIQAQVCRDGFLTIPINNPSTLPKGEVNLYTLYNNNRGGLASINPADIGNWVDVDFKGDLNESTGVLNVWAFENSNTDRRGGAPYYSFHYIDDKGTDDEADDTCIVELRLVVEPFAGTPEIGETVCAIKNQRYSIVRGKLQENFEITECGFTINDYNLSANLLEAGSNVMNAHLNGEWSLIAIKSEGNPVVLNAVELEDLNSKLITTKKVKGQDISVVSGDLDFKIGGKLADELELTFRHTVKGVRGVTNDNEIDAILTVNRNPFAGSGNTYYVRSKDVLPDSDLYKSLGVTNDGKGNYFLDLFNAVEGEDKGGEWIRVANDDFPDVKIKPGDSKVDLTDVFKTIVALDTYPRYGVMSLEYRYQINNRSTAQNCEDSDTVVKFIFIEDFVIDDEQSLTDAQVIASNEIPELKRCLEDTSMMNLYQEGLKDNNRFEEIGGIVYDYPFDKNFPEATQWSTTDVNLEAVLNKQTGTLDLSKYSGDLVDLVGTHVFTYSVFQPYDIDDSYTFDAEGCELTPEGAVALESLIGQKKVKVTFSPIVGEDVTLFKCDTDILTDPNVRTINLTQLFLDAQSLSSVAQRGKWFLRNDDGTLGSEVINGVYRLPRFGPQEAQQDLKFQFDISSEYSEAICTGKTANMDITVYRDAGDAEINLGRRFLCVDQDIFSLREYLKQEFTAEFSPSASLIIRTGQSPPRNTALEGFSFDPLEREGRTRIQILDPTNNNCALERVVANLIVQPKPSPGVYANEAIAQVCLDQNIDLNNYLSEDATIGGVFEDVNNKIIIDANGMIDKNQTFDNQLTIRYTVDNNACNLDISERQATFILDIVDNAAPKINLQTAYCQSDGLRFNQLKENENLQYRWRRKGEDEIINTLLIETGVYEVVRYDTSADCESLSTEMTITVNKIGQGQCSDGIGTLEDSTVSQASTGDLSVGEIGEVFPNMVFDIYNRYGVKVFSAVKSDIVPKGDGKFLELSKTDLPEGVYYYVITPNDEDSTTIQNSFYLSR